MPNRTRDELFERQKGESEQAYEAFIHYRDLGTERSTAKVAQALGKSLALIQRWCSRWYWVERCREWDSAKDAEARRAALKKYKDMNARHIRIALQLQEKALRAMEELPDDALSAKDVMQFIDKAIAIEKMTRREDAGITTDGKPGEQQGGGGRSLADEIIEAYETRKRGEEP